MENTYDGGYTWQYDIIIKLEPPLIIIKSA